MPTRNTASRAQTSLNGAALDMLKPEDIDFDPANPRFGKGARSGVLQEDLYAELLQDPHNATALVESFVENGFIRYEPLIVKPKAVGKGHLVIEGNRRLAAVKYIRSQPDRYSAQVRSR